MASDLRSQRSSSVVSTHAFQEFHNTRSNPREPLASRNPTRLPGDDDIFDTIIPNVGNSHPLNSHQELLNEDGDSSDGEYLSSRIRVRRKNELRSALVADVQSLNEDEESNFGDVPPVLRTTFLNLGKSSAVPSPERRSARPTSKSRVSVPARRSSRARAQSSGSGSDAGQVIEAELEAGQKLLAAVELSNQGSQVGARKSSVQTERSATPPPIGRIRRTPDESDGNESTKYPRPTTPERATFLQDAAQLLQVSRRHSQASLMSHRSQRSSKARSRHGGAGASSHEQERSGREPNLLPPGTRHSARPRSPNGTAKDFDESDEYAGSFPRYVPRPSHDSARGPRHASFTAGSSAHKPVSTANKVITDAGLAVSNNLPADRRSIVSHASSSRLPDFFSYEIFQVVLRNPTTAHQLLKFSETRLCSENIDFLNKVEEYQKALSNLTHVLATIHKGFISSHPANQLEVPDDVIRSVYKDVKSLAGKTLPRMETLFTDMQARIEELVFTDVYPRFVRHQLALSATRALAADRHRYAGLGDCFCLTNPNKADNPILFASDGFVKVTGYSRPEIIPRNCRFLQGPRTDRVPIRRLKQGIAECRDSVELILNYKKNGDPFWNLLYVAPLFDEKGKLAFFIGGQVNCSTTIHSSADIMKVLSASVSGEADDSSSDLPGQAPRQKHGPLPSARKAFLKAFGMRGDEAKVSQGKFGMEDDVLGRMEGQSLNAQMKEFSTAYSQYLVVRADSFIIRYYSEGVIEALHPANNAGLVAGQEVFRFFKQNMVSKEPDYRGKVRSALRSGNPISVELRLQTRRSARFRGDEVFVTHWTPLKDENAATHWVVITLGTIIQ